jgi:cytochrome c
VDQNTVPAHAILPDSQRSASCPNFASPWAARKTCLAAVSRRVPPLLAGLFVIAATATWAEGGDPARGERVFQYCYSCHSVQPGETGLQGPNLHGIVGRRIAAEADFAYSPAMRAFAGREELWSEALLDRFLAAPSDLVPKTSMEFRGVDDETERADLLAYLRVTGADR